MIPFWRKTGKHSKPQSAQKRRQNTKPAVPRTAQQSIPMQRMFEDGTCRVKPNYYTRTIQYQDINYQLAQQEDKTAIFEEWCSFLNFFDSSIKFELSFVNMATDSTEFEKSIFNSTALDGSRKFRDFFFSALAVQRLSDLICLEHQLSVIEKKPYRERQKRIVYPPKESNRDRLCGIIDTILAEKPGDYETFLQKLERQGYEVKRGKYTSVKGKGQKRFIRFRTLGTGYGEDEIKAVLEGKVKHQPYQKKPPKEQPFQLLVDIQGKMAEGKSVGYKKWAAKFNLKEMSKTLLFLQEQKIGSAEELRERATAATERYHAMGDAIKAAEARLTEIAVLKTHIINYAKTRDVYAAYRKAGYSKTFLDAHREEITLHKAAKAAFDEAEMQKLPKVKELDAEFAELLTKKKAAYPDYRKARNEMQGLVRAQKNVERFFAEEKPAQENEQAR